MYHPLPLNMIAGDEMSFLTALPHLLQATTGGSLSFCRTSKRLLQESHAYS